MVNWHSVSIKLNNIPKHNFTCIYYKNEDLNFIFIPVCESAH